MKNGDVVFFKMAQDSSHPRKSKKIQFKGMGFGVFLGHVPPFQKDPPPEHLLRLMGVAEFLGDEMGAKCVQMFEDKYYGKKIEGEAPAGSTLVNSAGQPVLTSVDTEPAPEPEV